MQVVNIAGGGGMVAFAQFISSKEGNAHSVLTQGAGHVLFPIANKTKVSMNDVTPVALLAGEWEVLVTKADSGINSIKELIAKYKADSGLGDLGGRFAGRDRSCVPGQPDHRAPGCDAKMMNFVPHENTGDIVIAVLGGQVSVGAGGYQDFAQQVESRRPEGARGRAHRNGVQGVDAPTLKEEGIDLVFANWRGVSAHKSLNEEQLEALDEVFAKLVKSAALEGDHEGARLARHVSAACRIRRLHQEQSGERDRRAQGARHDRLRLVLHSRHLFIALGR